MPVAAAAGEQLLTPDGVIPLVKRVIDGQRCGGREVAGRTVIRGVSAAIGAGRQTGLQIQR